MLEILVYQSIIHQSSMKNYQIKKIHLHFEVKNSESTSKSSNFATQFVSKENAIFLDEEIKYVRLINGEAMQSLKV